MSWSYTHPTGERYQSDGGLYAHWWNTWSVTELSPITPNRIRLRVSLSTSGFAQNGAYVWSTTDSILCGSASVPVCHCTVRDGTAYTADVEVPGSWSGQQIRLNIGWCMVRVVLTATAVLPTAITVEDGVFGEALPVRLIPALSGARHSLTVTCAGRSETLLTPEDADAALTWTPALADYAPLLPSSASAEAVFTCETFYSGVSMGESSARVTLRFAAGSLPPALSPGWAAAQAYNEGAAAGIRCFVQGYSRAEIVFDPAKIACPYGASVAAYSIRCEGETVSASPWRTQVLPAREAAIVCSVTDSRGQTASETLRVTLEGYAQPAITAPELQRCDAQGTPGEDGSCLAVTAGASISPLAGENSARLSVAVRPLNGSFGPETALSPGQTAILAGYSPDVSFEARLTLTDALGNSAAVRGTLPTRRWALKLREDGNGAAFGKAAEQNAALELADGWALVLHGPNGETARLDYASLAALLGTINN